MPTGPSKTASIREILTDNETYATTMVVLLVDRYGTEAATWTPETIRRELREDFGVTVPAGLIDKAMAGFLLLTSDAFYNDPAVFIQICNILAGDTFDPRVFDPADSYEMAWGITEAALLSPPEDTENAFSEDVRSYIGYQTVAEGISDPPDILAIGIRPVDRHDPNAVFADDPEIYNAFFDKKQADRTLITDMLRENLKELVGQLESLPLENGSTDDLITRLRKGL